MRIVIGTLLAIGLTAPAMAADMRMPTKAAPMMQTMVRSWAGLYIGANVGYGWGRANASGLVTGGTLAGSTATGGADLNGINGGGQIGYNWQVGQMVFGLEADLQAAGQSASVTVAGLTETAKINWFGTARGRLGFAVNNLLIYGTGGAAWSNFSHTLTGGGVTIIDLSSTRAGWTIGGGVEAMLSGNWSAKLEYLHIRTDGFGGTAAIPAPVGGSYTETVSIANNVVRLGVNYRF